MLILIFYKKVLSYFIEIHKKKKVNHNNKIKNKLLVIKLQIRLLKWKKEFL
jgi:hypothetical protein